MRKTALFIISAFLLMLLLCPAVYADVIVEPYGNTFFEAHYKECTLVDRNFKVNETVSVFASPEDTKLLGRIAAGSIININNIYTAPDGTEWGISITDGYRDGVWMRMASLTVIYDHISFDEEYGHTFTEYDASKHIIPEGAMCFWTYPNSGVVAHYTSEINPSFGQSYVSGSIDKVYTDAAGIAWGHVSYYYGIRNVWIAFADVTGMLGNAVFNSHPGTIGENQLDGVSVITTVATPVDVDVPATTDDTLKIQQPHISYAEPQNEWVLPTVIAVVLAAAAAVLIVVFIRKNKKPKGN